MTNSRGQSDDPFYLSFVIGHLSFVISPPKLPCTFAPSAASLRALGRTKGVVCCLAMTAAAFERRSRPEATHATFNEQFRHAVERFADRVAFRLKQATGYREVTYREVDGQASAVAAGLVGIGNRPGDRVGILSENRPEWVIYCLGILMAGATAGPLGS